MLSVDNPYPCSELQNYCLVVLHSLHSFGPWLLASALLFESASLGQRHLLAQVIGCSCTSHQLLWNRPDDFHVCRTPDTDDLVPLGVVYKWWRCWAVHSCSCPPCSPRKPEFRYAVPLKIWSIVASERIWSLNIRSKEAVREETLLS